jgi:hypothetical protein
MTRASFDSVRQRSALTAVLVVGGFAGLGGPAALAQDPRSVKADYEVSFAGVTVGDFAFDAAIEGRSYTIKSATSIELLFGALKWTSQSVSDGAVHGDVAPEAFSFSYRSNRKAYRTSMRFARGDVVAVDNRPPVKPSRKRVPLKPEHLKGVLDPMSAIMAMTRGSKRNPCDRSVEVFEGRMRFKLTLEDKGRRRIRERGNSGQPRLGVACRIRVTPIAGHKRDKAMRQIAASRDIEVVLRPVPDANLWVPYLITVPTGYGTVAIASRRVEIIGGRRQRIALRH